VAQARQGCGNTSSPPHFERALSAVWGRAHVALRGGARLLLAVPVAKSRKKPDKLECHAQLALTRRAFWVPRLTHACSCLCAPRNMFKSSAILLLTLASASAFAPAAFAPGSKVPALLLA
jgi:hypothetical protein